MKRITGHVLSVSVLLLFIFENSVCNTRILSTDEMENFINPEDLEAILNYYQKNASTGSGIVHDALELATTRSPAVNVGCFGTGGSIIIRAFHAIFGFNLKPSPSKDINTHFYFMSRKMSFRVQVYPGRQFGIESVDFDPKRKTVLIVHGFMSYGGADWVTQMTKAYLEREDVNVIAVDWSGGSNTFKYWRAVANTRTVGRDIVTFMGQLRNATGLDIKNCHFIGHSLGAQIASFASYQLGRVGRITGLDPALPCFNTTKHEERLDPTDADFVDVIHTNGKLSMIGFGFPYPTGHADFYPNGGIRQPGCSGFLTNSIPIYNTINQAICSHGRSYVLFTESMANNNCSFKGSPWNLTVSGLEESVSFECDGNRALCPEMGIKAAREARGSFLVFTKDRKPYCENETERHHPSQSLLQDITNYLQIFGKDDMGHTTPSNAATSLSSIISFRRGAKALRDMTTVAPYITTTTSGWISRVFKYFQSREATTVKPDVDENANSVWD